MRPYAGANHSHVDSGEVKLNFSCLVALADCAQQKLFILSHTADSFDVAAKAMAAGGVEEELHVGFLAGFEKCSIHGYGVLKQNVRILHAVDKQQLPFEVFG